MDPLTGAADVDELMEKLRERDLDLEGNQYGLIVVGIVGLRVINAEFGWSLGNAVLTSLSTRLTASTSSTCVARVDSDKFAVLIDDVDREDVRETGARMKRLLNSAPWEIEGVSVPVRIRATFAIGPAPSDTPEMNVLWAALRINRTKQIRDLKERVADLESQLRLREDQADVGAFRAQHAVAIAHHDELTRVLNRDGYLEMLPKFEPPYALAVFDVDNLRELNKTPGLNWKAGDLALVMVALFLKDLTSDVVVVRLGGDVFLAMFPDRTATEVKGIVESALLVSKEKLIVGDTLVTFSGGIASVTDSQMHLDAVEMARLAIRRSSWPTKGDKGLS
jgi:diguanylate cyclase (GGDEF)-like protein